MRSDVDRVRDILEAIERIGRHTGDGRVEFDRNELVQVWVWSVVERELSPLDRALRPVLDDRPER